jgi:sec-independent protein translocase protein TatC
VPGDLDPDDYRMSVGDHLEELRSRLIKALLGVIAAFLGCLLIAKHLLLPFIASPLIRALKAADVAPQMFFTNVTDPFFVYLKISLIGAFVVAGPWVLWQGWQFIAAGLYRNERKAVTRYLPFSLGLFFGGIFFAWWPVLPMTLGFFLSWGMTIPLPDAPPTRLVEGASVANVPMLEGDPAQPQLGDMWFNTLTQQLKVQVSAGGNAPGASVTRVLNFTSTNLAAPLITLPQYVNLVLLLIVVFGLSFQMPLVVMALIRLDIVRPDVLRENRRYVYFIMVIAACIITPGDVVVVTVALLGPLIVLYEVGIWLGERGLGGRGWFDPRG